MKIIVQIFELNKQKKKNNRTDKNRVYNLINGRKSMVNIRRPKKIR